MLYQIDITIASVQAICVVPTRELAIQIVDTTITPLSQFMDQSKFSTKLAISQMQMERVDGGAKTKKITSQIVVGTPGKVVDWLKRRYIDVSTVKVLVLDEADAMVETHRANSILIRKHLPASHNVQCLLFSATFPTSTLEFARKILIQNEQECERILIDSEDLVLNVIKQVWIDTRSVPYSKLEFLADIYSILTIAQSIVFVNTKSDADRVYATLSHGGYTCSVIHSGIEDRDEVMQDFRNGKSNVLISTNVLARGVDVDAVCLVINYDVRTYTTTTTPCCHAKCLCWNVEDQRMVAVVKMGHVFMFAGCILIENNIWVSHHHHVVLPTTAIDKDGKGDAETYLHR
jgi:ATP-dependent RNA helicase DDX19/DBP5